MRNVQTNLADSDWPTSDTYSSTTTVSYNHSARVDIIDRVIPGIHIPITPIQITHSTHHRVLLRPPAQIGIIIACAELGQARICLAEAADILPGIIQPILLHLAQDLSIRVIIVKVDQAATAIGHANHRP